VALRDAEPPPKVETLRVLMDAAEAARKGEDWKTAKALLASIRQMMQKKLDAGSIDADPYIIQQLALATYKADNSVEALKEAHDILSALGPEASNDPETLSLWGAIHKRLWDKTNDRGYLDKAIAAYEKGFSVKSDYYNGINVAYLLDLRASISSGDDTIADRVQAKRIRRQLTPTAEALLKEEVKPAERYWVMATLAEAYCGIGDEAKYQEWIAKATAAAPERWMVDTTLQQIQRLRTLQSTSTAATA
jgi:tetratricopeptide (TPR) repeat protein